MDPEEDDRSDEESEFDYDNFNTLMASISIRRELNDTRPPLQNYIIVQTRMPYKKYAEAINDGAHESYLIHRERLFTLIAVTRRFLFFHLSPSENIFGLANSFIAMYGDICRLAERRAGVQETDYNQQCFTLERLLQPAQVHYKFAHTHLTEAQFVSRHSRNVLHFDVNNTEMETRCTARIAILELPGIYGNETYASIRNIDIGCTATTISHVILDHPNVATFYTSYPVLCQNRAATLSLFEYMPGVTLLQFINKLGRLNITIIRHVTACVVNALKHIHYNGFCHSNINPSKIMIDHACRIKLIDNQRYAISLSHPFRQHILPSFHSAQTYIFERPPKQGAMLAYHAPEYLKNGKLSYACDWWSLGMTIHKMYTGDLPKRKYRSFDATWSADIILERRIWSIANLRDFTEGLLKANPLERRGSSGFRDSPQDPPHSLLAYEMISAHPFIANHDINAFQTTEEQRRVIDELRETSIREELERVQFPVIQFSDISQVHSDNANDIRWVSSSKYHRMRSNYSNFSATPSHNVQPGASVIDFNIASVDQLFRSEPMHRSEYVDEKEFFLDEQDGITTRLIRDQRDADCYIITHINRDSPVQEYFVGDVFWYFLTEESPLAYLVAMLNPMRIFNETRSPNLQHFIRAPRYSANMTISNFLFHTFQSVADDDGIIIFAHALFDNAGYDATPKLFHGDILMELKPSANPELTYNAYEHSHEEVNAFMLQYPNGNFSVTVVPLSCLRDEDDALYRAMYM